jgi:MarR family transcriptional regulator, multiple antibiotic resistance protein MarR
MKNIFINDEYFDAWIGLSHTRDVLWKVRQKELNNQQITVRQAAILFIIQSLGDKATPVAITKRVSLQAHSVSEHLTRMEESGLIQRLKNLDKKNMIRIQMTKKGCQVYNESIQRKSIYQVMTCLSRKELQQFTSILLKLEEKGTAILGERNNNF